jgi:hypothetical protein
VSIITAKIEALIAAHFLEAHPDISLNISDEVAYVQRTICIGQS